jgi:hypothetical protein
MAKKLIALALVTVAIVLGCTNYTQNRRENKAWTLACDLSGADCSQLKAPIVSYEVMSPNLFGWYDEGNIIHVNKDYRNDPEVILTIIHEMVHYIQVQQWGYSFPMPKSVACVIEAQAFGVEEEAGEILGMDTTSWDNIKGMYGCAWPAIMIR